MKKAEKVLMIIATLIITVSVFVACGHKGNEDADYTVTYVTNGGSAVASAKLSNITVEPTTTREGYDFAGWFDNADFNGARIVFPYTLSKNTTLYAKWTKKQTEVPDDPSGFTVTFETNGGSAVARMKVKTIAQEPATSREGYEFEGWFDNQGLSGSRITFPYTVTKDATLYAKWTEIQVSQWVQTTIADYETEQTEDGKTNILSYKGNSENIILPGDENVTFSRSFLWPSETFTVKGVRIPSTITEINTLWFPYSKVEQIEVEDGHPTMCAVDGVLYSKDKTVLLAYPRGRKDATYTILSTVKIIGENVFNTQGSIVSLTIPDGVEKLESYCFAGMPKLKSIVLPSTLTEIGGYTFYGCPLIEEVEFPKSITACGYSTFNKGCTSLRRVIAPSCIRFSGVPNIEYFEINAGEDCTGVSFSKNTTLTKVVFNEGFKSIGNSMFDGCAALKDIELPDTLTTIGKYAFRGCTSLSRMILPNGVTKVDIDAFANSGIEELYFPESITAFGKLTNMLRLTTLSCPGGMLTKLYSSLYQFEQSPVQYLTVTSGEIPNTSGSYYCGLGSIHSLTIGEDVTAIDEAAFADCEAIVQITNLSGVSWEPKQYDGVSVVPRTGVEYRTSTSTAFSGVLSTDKNGFTKYEYNGEVIMMGGAHDITELKASDFQGYTAIGNLAFIGCKQLLSVSIPSNIKMIGVKAFKFCQNLESLTIADGVEQIGKSAFTTGSSKLTSITIPHSVTTVGENAFFSSDTITINVKGYSSAPAGWHNKWYNVQGLNTTVNWNA